MPVKAFWWRRRYRSKHNIFLSRQETFLCFLVIPLRKMGCKYRQNSMKCTIVKGWKIFWIEATSLIGTDAVFENISSCRANLAKFWSHPSSIWMEPVRGGLSNKPPKILVLSFKDLTIVWLIWTFIKLKLLIQISEHFFLFYSRGLALEKNI